MDMRRLVGRNFAHIRREKGLTQEQVEGTIGIQPAVHQRVEQGRRNPTVVTLYELAQALGVTPSALALQRMPPPLHGALWGYRP